MPDVTLLLANQRCGTTALTASLGSHPGVVAFGEVFHNQRQNQEENFFYFLRKHELLSRFVTQTKRESREIFHRYVRYLARIAGCDKLVMGCKYNSLHHQNPVWHAHGARPFLFNIFKQAGWRVLHVRRQLLDRVVSEKLAAKRNQYHSTQSVSLDGIKVNLNAKLLLPKLRLEASTSKKIQQCCESLDKFDVSYESLFDGEQCNPATFDAIANWMGIDNRFKSPALRKITIGRALNDLVENWAEIQTLLSGTEFSGSVQQPNLGGESR